MPKIEIYYAQICGLCHEAMDFFCSRNLPFIAHEVFWDKEKDNWEDSETVREMKARAGDVDFVPQIFINDTTHIAGWRVLQAMIASGEFDRLISQQADHNTSDPREGDA